MATYAEVNSIWTDTTPGSQALREKVGIACLVAADIIISGEDSTDPPWATGGHDQRIKWVHRLLGNYEMTAREIFGLVIASNVSFTQAQILGASDAAIQSSVNASIDSLAANLV
jgi:hypothetical protein